jgi:PST family polysaccharide transporter
MRPFSYIARFRAYLDSRPDVRKIVNNASWLFSDRVIRLVVTLFVSSWVARYLGTEQFGILSLAITFTSLGLPLIRLGLDSLIVQFLVQEEATQQDVLGTAFRMRLVAALIVLPIVLLLTMRLYGDNPIIGALSSLLAIGVLIESFDVIDFWFQSQLSSRYVVWARNVTFLLTSAGKVFAILLQAPLLVFGVLYMLDTVMYIVTLIYTYHHSGNRISQWEWNTDLAKKLLRLGAPLILSGIAVSLYMRIDQLMLSFLIPGKQGEEAVGVYAVAVRLSEAWYFVPLVIVSSMFPAILLSKKTSEELYRKRIQRLFNIAVLISYVFAIPITFLSPIIINLLFGAEYAEAASQLAVLVWAGVWVALGVCRSFVLLAENANELTLYGTIIGAVINIILNFILIPTLGGLGCAIATLIAQIFAAHLSTFLHPRLRFLGWSQTVALVLPNPLPPRSIQRT